MTNDAYEQLAHGGAAGIMKPHPALHRVIPPSPPSSPSGSSPMTMPGPSSWPPRPSAPPTASVARSGPCLATAAPSPQACASASLSLRKPLPARQSLSGRSSHPPRPLRGNRPRPHRQQCHERHWLRLQLLRLLLRHPPRHQRLGHRKLRRPRQRLRRDRSGNLLSLRLLRRSVPGACHLPAGRHVSH